MSLPRMRLDFAAAEEGASWSGIAALLAGLAAAALLAAGQQRLAAEKARLEAELGRLAAHGHAGARSASPAEKPGDAVARANAIAYELARRWDRVFLAIETAVAPQVALLAIEPDARKGLVRITAEAKAKNDMLDYVASLQAAAPLERVVLERHQVLVDTAQRPVRFVVLAWWQVLP